MKLKKTIFLLILAISLAGCNHQKTSISNNQEQLSLPVKTESENMKKEEKVIKTASGVIKTEKGDIEVELFGNQAPKTVDNFIEKAKSGYYEGLVFHRIEDWVVQGGDPLGTGTGGGKMKTELSQAPFEIGSLGVARGGDIKISNDSQFFICTKKCDWLNGQYTNFGKVIKGMEVVNMLEIGDKILSIKIKEN